VTGPKNTRRRRFFRCWGRGWGCVVEGEKNVTDRWGNEEN